MAEWRDVVGYEGYYQVSDEGQVRSLLTNKALKAHPDRRGYLGVSLYSRGRDTRKRKPIHTLVAESFIGPRPEGLDVCHNDGDKLNNRACNLRYGTRSENIMDAAKHGTHYLGSKRVCKRGHQLGVHTERSQGCRACARASSTVRYQAHLADRIDEVADVHYRNILGENRRLRVSEIEVMLSSG